MFNWELNETAEVQRKAFCEAKKEWEVYLKVIKKDSENHYVLLEFVKDDTLEQFLNEGVEKN